MAHCKELAAFKAGISDLLSDVRIEAGSNSLYLTSRVARLAALAVCTCDQHVGLGYRRTARRADLTCVVG